MQWADNFTGAMAEYRQLSLLERAAMMGGILSNNSSGMCCGVQQNSYHTMKFITFILPIGLIFNTERQIDYARFENEAAEIAKGIKDLREQILENQTLQERFFTSAFVGLTADQVLRIKEALEHLPTKIFDPYLAEKSDQAKNQLYCFSVQFFNLLNPSKGLLK